MEDNTNICEEVITSDGDKPNAGDRSVIPEEVFGTIACIAALEVEGIYSLGGNITKEKAAKLGSRNLGSSVKVSIEERNVTISLSAEIEYGYKAYEVAEAVSLRVKQAVENMTEFSVAKVNVFFASIHIDSKRP